MVLISLKRKKSQQMRYVFTRIQSQVIASESYEKGVPSAALDRGLIVEYSKCVSIATQCTQFYHTVNQKASDKSLIFAVGYVQHLLYDRMVRFLC
jgi:hypothetical protein